MALAALDEFDVGNSVLQQGRRYFSKLDLLTNPSFSIQEERIQSVSSLLGLLKLRVLHRRNNSSLPGINHEPYLGTIKEFSKLMINLLEEHFGAPVHACTNHDLIGESHELFAMGALATWEEPGVRTPNNVPDGASIFFFAEFGHVAIDSGVEPEAWLCLLPIFTRMPALYLKVHQLHDPASLPGRFADFGPPPSFGPYRDELKTFAEQIRSQYEAMNVSQLSLELGNLASQAFSDF